MTRTEIMQSVIKKIKDVGGIPFSITNAEQEKLTIFYNGKEEFTGTIEECLSFLSGAVTMLRISRDQQNQEMKDLLLKIALRANPNLFN